MESVPLIKTKDVFGGDLTFTDPSKISKRKAWNLLLKSGYKICPNNRYITNGEVYFHNNSLLPYLIMEMGG